MCWISTKKDGKATAKVAKKDIPIIKIGHRRFNRFVSAGFAYEYRMGELQKSIKIKSFGGYYIEEGYHFYKPGMTRIENVGESFLVVYGTLCKNGHFHQYLITETSCVAKGYIPKGTVYYLNAIGVGVAEQIVLTEMIDMKDYLTNKKLSKL